MFTEESTIVFSYLDWQLSKAMILTQRDKIKYIYIKSTSLIDQQIPELTYTSPKPKSSIPLHYITYYLKVIRKRIGDNI